MKLDIVWLMIDKMKLDERVLLTSIMSPVLMANLGSGTTGDNLL